MSAPTLSKSEATPSRTGRPGSNRTDSAREEFMRSVRRNLSAHGFLIGAVLCFSFFSWYPMVREFILAFQKNENGKTTWAAGPTSRTSSTTPPSGRPGATRCSSPHSRCSSDSSSRSSSPSYSTNSGTARDICGCSSIFR